jgi:hypothetical protein
VLVVVGGIIPDVDIPKLNEIGIEGVFLPVTPDAGHRRLHQPQRRSRVVFSRDAEESFCSPTTAFTIQRVIELTFSGEDVQVLAVGDGEEAIARIPLKSRTSSCRHRDAEAERLRGLGIRQEHPRVRPHSCAAAGRRV